ncbi:MULTISPECIES: hypothetical protein [Actinoalloteichus]|uniref:hypothetical protein n=1 Tax=Actinoalloteichus TaxID=65496 RepID=UPI0004A9EF83|nr:hypothetical protein [Actinoalloteichus caeruleus]
MSPIPQPVRIVRLYEWLGQGMLALRTAGADDVNVLRDVPHPAGDTTPPDLPGHVRNELR